MKKRLKATHFIEQYGASGVYFFTDVLPIRYVNQFLKDTANTATQHTVAIFKIKFKQP